MNKIEIIESLPGSGKTEVLIQEIKSQKYNKIVWAAPTINLLKETYNRFIDNGINPQIFYFSLEKEKSVSNKILEYISNKDQYFILITTKTYYELSSRLTDNDILVIDEEIEAHNICRFIAKEDTTKQLIDTYIKFDELSDGMGYLRASKNIKNIKVDDTVYSEFMKNKLFRFILRDEYTVIYNKISSTNEEIKFDYVIMPNIKYILKNKRIVYIGHNVSKCFTSLLYKKFSSVEFITSPLENNLLFKEYKNPVKIYYIFSGIVGNNKISSFDEDMFIKIKNCIEKSHFIDNVIYSIQEDKGYIVPSFTNSHEISKKPCGLNNSDWMAKDKIVLLNNFYLSPYESNLLGKLGYTKEDCFNARHRSLLIQQITRSGIRKNTKNQIDILVIDENTADILKETFKLTNAEKIESNIDYFTNPAGRPALSEDKKKYRSTIRDRIKYLKRKSKNTTLNASQNSELLKLTLEYNSLKHTLK